MYKGKDLLGKKVIDRAEGKELYKVQDVLFNGADGYLVGFLVEEGGLLSSSKVLPASSAASIGVDAIVIDSADQIIKASADERIKTLLNDTTVAIGTKLMTENGKDLGKIKDIYFSETDGKIAGYQVSGGLFADAYTGYSYLPYPETMRMGDDVAFVPNTTTDVLNQQDDGGIKCAASDAKDSTVETYQRYKVISQDKMSELSDDLQDKYHEYKDMTQEKYSELSDDSKETYDSWKDKADEQMMHAKGEAAQRAAVQTVDQTIGKRANHDVYANNQQLIAAQGQFIHEADVAAAKEHDKEAALVDAVNLSSRETFSHGAKQAMSSVSDSASGAWDKVKSSASGLTQQASDKLEAERIKHILGKPANRVVLDTSDNVILNLGDIITHEAVEKARQGEVLNVLLLAGDGDKPKFNNQERTM